MPYLIAPLEMFADSHPMSQLWRTLRRVRYRALSASAGSG